MAKRYLDLRSLDEALTLLTTSFPRPQRTETIPVTQASGRVVAEPVHAKYSVPEVSISAMDGIAVRSRDTLGAGDRNPVTLEHAVRVNTGNVVPPEFDAVVMIEDVWEEDGRYQIRRAAVPRQHVRPAGENRRGDRGGHGAPATARRPSLGRPGGPYPRPARRSDGGRRAFRGRGGKVKSPAEV